MEEQPGDHEEAAVPIDLDRSLANFDVEDVGSCGKAWAKIRVTGNTPRGRASHSATLLDSFRFVVIGGGSCNSSGDWVHFGDAHVFDVRTRSWHELSPVIDERIGAFPARRGHVAALWRVEEILVFGGTAGGTGIVGMRNDCWALDIASPAWRKLDHTGEVPAPRRGALGCFVVGHFLIAGGYVPTGYDSKIYALEPSTSRWSHVVTTGEQIPFFALAAGATVGSDMFIFGGSPSAGFLRLHVSTAEEKSKKFDKSQGSDLRISAVACDFQGDAPSLRFCHGMTAIANRWLLVFGGTSVEFAGSPRTLNDCYLLDLRRCARSGVPVVHSRSVQPIGPAGVKPSERNGFTMVGVGTKFIIFGGGVYSQAYYNDVWAMDLKLKPTVAIPVDTPGSELGADFLWLRDNEDGLALADLELDVGVGDAQQTFPAHKAVLCARSEYFRALLMGGFRESGSSCRRIALPELNPMEFEVVLSYLYTGVLSVPSLDSAEEDDEDAALQLADASLLDAVRSGELEDAADALQRGADPDARDPATGYTPAHVVASSELAEGAVAVDVVNLLATARADLNAATPLGETPLQLAATGARKDVAKALVIALRGNPSEIRSPKEAEILSSPATADKTAEACDPSPATEAITSVLRVLLCADRLGLTHLGLLCERWLSSAMRVGNACELLEVADDMRCAQLRLVCIHFLKKHGRCRRSPEFSALPQHLQQEVVWASQSL